MNNIVTIKNEKDVVNFLENMDNMDFLKKKVLKFDGTQVKLNLEGDNFNSSLTGSLIIGMAKFQERIYNIYLTNKYGVGTRRKITPEEAKLLEIKVVINKGSTVAYIELAYKVIKEAMTNMTPAQIQATLYGLAAIVMGGVCLLGIGSKAVAGAFKNRRKSLKQKREQSKDDVEKKRIESQEALLNTAIEAMREMSLGIIKSAPDKVAINDKVITTKNITNVANELELKLEKPEVIENQTVITGTYRIQRVTLDFKKDTASFDVFNVENGDPIHGIIVQPKSISDGSYRVLKTAQDQHDIKLQLIVTMRDDRIHKAVLDKIL